MDEASKQIHQLVSEAGMVVQVEILAEQSQTWLAQTEKSPTN